MGSCSWWNLTSTQLYSGVYSWDTSYLAAGVYQVYGTVSSGSSGVYRPNPALGDTDLFLEGPATTAPGSIVLADSTGPAAPDGLALTQMSGGLRACWNPSSAHDVAGYVVRLIQ